jgi:hypothetical protein
VAQGWWLRSRRIHHGIGSPVAAPFDRSERVKRKPGGIRTKFLTRLLSTYGLTNKGKDERLRHAHDREIVLRIANGMNLTVGSDFANAKKLTRHLGEGRIDLRILTVSVRLVSRIHLIHQPAISSAGGKLPVET